MAKTVTFDMDGGHKMDGAIRRILKRLTSAKGVKVGFLPKSKYPDGTPVAQVAFWQEFGTSKIPPRPFFRPTIAEHSKEWGPNMAKIMKATDYDTDKTLALMGEDISGELRNSIINMEHLPLSPITLMLRKMVDEDSSLIVTGATVGEAARRVAAGEEGATGTRARPLIDSGVMAAAPTYVVER